MGKNFTLLRSYIGNRNNIIHDLSQLLSDGEIMYNMIVRTNNSLWWIFHLLQLYIAYIDLRDYPQYFQLFSWSLQCYHPEDDSQWRKGCILNKSNSKASEWEVSVLALESVQLIFDRHHKPIDLKCHFLE